MPQPRRTGLRRILRIVGLSLASLVALLVIAAIAFTLVGSIGHTDTFSLADAEPVSPTLLDELAAEPHESRFTREPSVYGVHRLKPGRGLVLGYRAFSPGNAWIIDDESYDKLTIWLPQGISTASKAFDLAKDPVVVTLSSGSSAWSQHGCSGYVDSGRLHVEQKSGGYAVLLRGEFKPKASPEHCKPWPIEREFSAWPIAFEALTPWLGGPATADGMETYR